MTSESFLAALDSSDSSNSSCNNGFPKKITVLLRLSYVRLIHSSTNKARVWQQIFLVFTGNPCVLEVHGSNLHKGRDYFYIHKWKQIYLTYFIYFYVCNQQRCWKMALIITIRFFHGKFRKEKRGAKNIWNTDQKQNNKHWHNSQHK